LTKNNKTAILIIDNVPFNQEKKVKEKTNNQEQEKNLLPLDVKETSSTEYFCQANQAGTDSNTFC
jgi:hypothetical protein